MSAVRRSSEMNLVSNDTPLPTIHIISDSLGATAHALARAAAGQFGYPDPYIETLPKARSFKEISDFLLEHKRLHAQMGLSEKLVVFYTFVDQKLRSQMQAFCLEQGLFGVDIMSEPLMALSKASGLTPSTDPGMLRHTDERYFQRIAAMEFTVEHDDGRNPQDLTQADIVLLGVSRSSKTPISIYLGNEGYKVANVPLSLGVQPPKELFEVDPSRAFGLMTTPEILVGIRQRRLRASGKTAIAVAGDYADPEMVYQDLQEARALMRKIGCIVIQTSNKAVEESAQEILRYYKKSHPGTKMAVE